MDADEIRDWSERYDEVYDDDLQAVEERIHEALTDQQYLTRDQLEDVVRWKLNGMPGRRGRNVDRVRTVPDEFVQRVTEAALLVDDPKTQLKTLKSIPGIGPATGTVVLAFYDPENYAIGDRYILDQFFGKDRVMRVTDYSDILEELRDRNPGDFDLRTVEKAYYQRYRIENDVGDW
jgi:Fe-S-cluster formation regulator IscX/YfhJ